MTETNKSTNAVVLKELNPNLKELSDKEFERLLLRFKEKFLPYAKKHAGEQEAEDALLETCRILWSKRDIYRHVSDAGYMGWALRTLQNVCRRIKTTAAKQDADEMPDGFDEWRGSEDPRLQESLSAMMARDERGTLLYLIEQAKLRQAHRACLLLSLANAPHPYIASILGITPESVRTHISTSKRQVKESLVPALVMLLTEEGGHWLGTVSRLLQAITQRTPQEMRYALPKNTIWLSRRLGYLQKTLGESGVAVYLYHTRRGTMVAMWKSEEDKVF